MRHLRAAAIVAVTALTVGVVMMVSGAFAANVNSGTFSMKPGTALNVTCTNALTNSNVLAHSETVNCAANTTTTTTTVGPTTTQPAPTTTTQASTTTTVPATTTTTQPVTTTTAPSGGTLCSVSGTDDYCPAPGADYAYPPDSLSNGGNVYINTDVWNPPPGFTGQTCKTGSGTPCQTVNAYNPGNWSVTTNLPDEAGAVLSSPQARTDLGFQPLSGFHSLVASSSDDLSAVATSSTGAEFGYDNWSSPDSSSAFSQEMMVWTDTVNRGVCGGATVVATGVPFGGSNGVPLLDWNLCVNGPVASTSEWIWYLPGAQDPSNTVDLYGMYQYMVSHGYYSSATGLNQLDETFELCSTGGQFQTYTANNLTISSS